MAARTYLVFGYDSKGDSHLVTQTPSAREAKTFRDAGNSPFARTAVHGADGELTIQELNVLAEKEARIA